MIIYENGLLMWKLKTKNATFAESVRNSLSRTGHSTTNIPRMGFCGSLKLREKNPILSACHSALGDGGHLGIGKCRKKATSWYFWPVLNADIKEYIGNILKNYSVYVEFEYKLCNQCWNSYIPSHEPSLSGACRNPGQVNLAKITGFENYF